MTPHDRRSFYIGGQWVAPAKARELEVVNPATESAVGVISLAGAADVDRAVAAARAAFADWSQTPVAERLALLRRLLAAYQSRQADVAAAISAEMGAPVTLATRAQAPSAAGHLRTMIEALPGFEFERAEGAVRLRYEPIGVAALITPWNWPMNQVACKVVPALAAGCTMVLKPSELAPLSAAIWAEAVHEAGCPPGVFNLVNGEGPTAGAALAGHPDVDMVSFTGSTRGGVAVAQAAAPTVKRVHQELGGKSPCVVLGDADLPRAVKATVMGVMTNSGQSCNAPTRLLVPADRLAEAEVLAADVVDKLRVGDPADPATQLGPLVSRRQFERVQDYLDAGLKEGARRLCGGPGRPAGLDRGWFARPTVFSSVSNDMRIAREEIFGPVLCLMPYRDEAEALRIANDTPYGLAAYVWSADTARARAVACRLRAGMVQINGAPLDQSAPFGGYRQSGNGREWGLHGLREFLEIKALLGDEAGPGGGGETA